MPSGLSVNHFLGGRVFDEIALIKVHYIRRRNVFDQGLQIVEKIPSCSSLTAAQLLTMF